MQKGGKQGNRDAFFPQYLDCKFSSQTEAFFMRKACMIETGKVVQSVLEFALVPIHTPLNPALREAKGDQFSQRCHFGGFSQRCYHHYADSICLAPQAMMGHSSQPKHQVEATTPVLSGVLGQAG